ncbi:MAG: thioredoxin-dependent thiol peroxidase [Candidatus Bathyarchaeota archaeon]|nr:MAG: thioredoxin-dependent thiol peroxidase [Candidatus Bathyarchaeota archaeon]
MVSEGEEAPDFTLIADDGREVSLSDYLNKKIVLYFYPKDGTLGCTREAIEFRDMAREFGKEDIVILGVSKDSIQSHQKFKRKHELPFTLLSDPEGKVLDLYGVWKKKSLYGRTFMSTERTTFLIDEKGIVKKVYRKVKVKGHAQACLLDLKGGTTGKYKTSSIVPAIELLLKT